jgi:hypothetical protein
VIRGEGRGALVRPTLCGLLILLSALPFAVVAPRLKAEYDHMRRSDVSTAPVAPPAPSVEVYTAPRLPQVQDGRSRKELNR